MIANARASVNQAIANAADAGVPILWQPYQDWPSAPAYRTEWGNLDAPRAANLSARNLRIHVHDLNEQAAEMRLHRLLTGLGFTSNLSVIVVPELDFVSNPTSPPQIGLVSIEKAPLGTQVVQVKEGAPTIRHLVSNLVVVYTLP